MRTRQAGERIPMAWSDYEDLGDEVRGEYIDGALVMSPPPTQRHQDIQFRLRSVLEPQLPQRFKVSHEWAWKAGDDEFLPDVMVHERTADQTRLTAPPVLVVEILSSDHARDTIRKFAKYAAAGVDHYWIIDPDSPTIVSYVLDDGTYREVRRVDAGADRPARFEVDGATVEVHPAELDEV